jgi:pimeloyl-ACP methyl ester carboxylesterase
MSGAPAECECTPRVQDSARHFDQGARMSKFSCKGLIALQLAAFGSAFSLPASSQTNGLPTTAPPPPPLVWQACPDSPTRDCATLKVPLDYADLGKGFIDLPVVRVRATASSIGTLVYNPGGPGIPVTGILKDPALGDPSFTKTLLKRFDLVGFDPRGTTDGILCMTGDMQEQYWESNLLPRTNTQLATRMSQEKEINQGCRDNNQPLVNHLNTASTVRDMEQLRRAMGINTFSYMGRSYGTFIGYRYAKLYPGHLRAMVLDAVVDLTVTDKQSFLQSTAAYEQMWTQFKAWCQANTSCHFRNQDVDAVFNQVLARARTHPIPAPRGPITQRPVNDWILTFIAQAFAAPGDITFNSVDQLIYEATLNDASVARYYYDYVTGAQSDGSYYPDSSQHRAITCEDTTWSMQLTTPGSILALISDAKQSAPRFGEASVSQGPVQCVGFPIAAVEPPPLPLQLTNVPPVLVVGATLDAMTPLQWAQHISAQISGSRLLTRSGYGHVSYDKSRCVQQKVDNYLINLALPAAGTTCPTDPDLYPPQDLLLPPLP